MSSTEEDQRLSNFRQTNETRETKRLAEFMSSALGKNSTMTEPDGVTFEDIAFVVEYLKILPKQSNKVKMEMMKNMPILTLVTMLFSMHTDGVDTIIKGLSTHADEDVRGKMADMFSLEQLGMAMAEAALKTDQYRTKLWRLFTGTLSDPMIRLPVNISDAIQNSIIKQRCGTDPKFLSRTSQSLIAFNDLFVDNTSTKAAGFNTTIDHPLNSKDQLCPVVKNLNTMADQSIENEIGKCMVLLKKHSPSGLGLTEDQEVYQTLKAEVDAFVDIVKKWDTLTAYTCESGECTYKSEKLQLVSDKVRAYAKTCMSSINARKKTELKKRRKNGDKTLTFGEKLKSWF